MAMLVGVRGAVQRDVAELHVRCIASDFISELALLSHGLARLSIRLNASIRVGIPEPFIKCFHGCPTVEESSAFIFHSRTKSFRDSTVGNTVVHEANSR